MEMTSFLCSPATCPHATAVLRLLIQRPAEGHEAWSAGQHCTARLHSTTLKRRHCMPVEVAAA